MTYRLKVNQQWKIVLVLILCPMLFIATLLAIILPIRDLPEWAVWTSIYGMIGLMLATTIFIVLRWLTVECRIELREEGMQFELLKATPFMRLHHFSCNWANIANVSINEDNYTDTLYYSIRFRKPDLTLYLTDIPPTPLVKSSGSDFWKEISAQVRQYNQQTASPEMQIHHIGFFQQLPAKLFTGFILVSGFLITLTVITGYGNIPVWRVVAFWAFATPWLSSYFRALKAGKDHSAL